MSPSGLIAFPAPSVDPSIAWAAAFRTSSAGSFRLFTRSSMVFSSFAPASLPTASARLAASFALMSLPNASRSAASSRSRMAAELRSASLIVPPLAEDFRRDPRLRGERVGDLLEQSPVHLGDLLVRRVAVDAVELHRERLHALHGVDPVDHRLLVRVVAAAVGEHR